MSVGLFALHGFLGSPEALQPAIALCTTPWARCVVPTLPGHGPRGVAERESFESLVESYAKTLHGHDISWVISGYSMGARLALAVALRMLREPTPRPLALVLNGVDPGIQDPAAREARQQWEHRMSDALPTLGIDAFVARLWESIPIFESQRSLSPVHQEALRARRSQHAPAGVAWAMTTLGTGAMPAMSPEFASLAHTPVWLVTGALDSKFTALSHTMTQQILHATHTVVPRRGHDLWTEAPRVIATHLDLAARALESARSGATA
ncbi:MAG: alpha/beta fold hydrolase [Deltaproteobacteria bacterium]|nr:alpha/beta fold hydrolase [Deltaproteobacteria bacterium]